MARRLFRNKFAKSSVFIVLVHFLCIQLSAQKPVILTLDLENPGHVVSPNLYGLMTEEINFSYEGGIYGELIRNRIFQDSATVPAFWHLLQAIAGICSMSLDRSNPINPALPVSLRLDVPNAGSKGKIANEGFWGIAIRPGTTYKGSLYARQSGAMANKITISLENDDETTVYASTEIGGIDTHWQTYHFELKTADVSPHTSNAHFVITAETQGSYWFNLVSLFPPTYNDRPNGNRTDLMQMLAAMKPRFLRFPGGNYLEGDNFANRFDWKKTIGPVDQRMGHLSPW